MRVQVRSRLVLRMSEPGLNDFHVGTGIQQQRRLSVSQVVEREGVRDASHFTNWMPDIPVEA